MTGLIALSPPRTDLHLQIDRVFNAPREFVFRAFTETEHARHWWAPRRFTVTACEIDLRPGGAWRSRMESPDWGAIWIGGVYLEITIPDRLVFTFAVEDGADRPIPESLVMVTFGELNGMTLLSLHQSAFDDPDTCDGCEDAWTSALELLSEYLAKGLPAESAENSRG